MRHTCPYHIKFPNIPIPTRKCVGWGGSLSSMRSKSRLYLSFTRWSIELTCKLWGGRCVFWQEAESPQSEQLWLSRPTGKSVFLHTCNTVKRNSNCAFHRWVTRNDLLPMLGSYLLCSNSTSKLRNSLALFPFWFKLILCCKKKRNIRLQCA